MACSATEELPCCDCAKAPEECKAYHGRRQPPPPPPIKRDAFAFFFRHPEMAGNTRRLSALLPIKMNGSLPTGEECRGWGIRAVERPSVWRTIRAVLVMLVVTFWYTPYRLIKQNPADIQGALAPPTIAFMAIAVCFALPQWLLVTQPF